MAFIIDKDHIAEPDAKPGTNANAVGKIGPSTYKGDGSDLIHRFRMLDGDGMVYYEGRSNDNDSEAAFEPLDCFGEPNAGATTIQYWRNGKGGGWETL